MSDTGHRRQRAVVRPRAPRGRPATCITAGSWTRSRLWTLVGHSQPHRRPRHAAKPAGAPARGHRSLRPAFDLFFRAHRPPAPGLPLFSIGERARVVARPAPGVRRCRSSSRISGPGRTHTSDARASARGAAMACRARKTSRISRDAELERARELLQTLPWR